MTEHTKGILITLAGVLILSPDSLVIRLIQLDLDSHFLERYIYFFLDRTTMLVFFRKTTLQQFKNIEKHCCYRFCLPGTFGFVFAIQNTTVAGFFLAKFCKIFFVSFVYFFGS